MNQKTFAIDGATPRFCAADFVPRINLDIREALQQVFETGDWRKYHGDHSERLVTLLQSHFQRQHAMLCCSGTIAVELALRGAGVRAGDEVILAAYDFPGNFRAIEAIGAIPVLVDVVESGWSIDISQVAQVTNEKTRAILVSHLHGTQCDFNKLRNELTHDAASSICLVEDACQAPGAWQTGSPIGSLGDIAALSFGGSKLLTAGRGGAVLCDDDTMRQRIRVFADRGNDSFPLSELQAAVLIPQIESLAQFTHTRHEQAVRWWTMLENALPTMISDQLKCRQASSTDISAFYKLPLRCIAKSKLNRDQWIEVVSAEGVPIGPGFRGFTKRSPRRCRKPVALDHAKDASENTLLLHHAILDTPWETQTKICELLQDIHLRNWEN